MPDIQFTSTEGFYEKSNYFRVIHADGIYGGITPTGGVHVGFYSQRSPLPKRSDLRIGSDGSGSETVMETKSGLFREFEVDVIMDFNTALAFHFWLTTNLAQLRKHLKMSDQDWAKHMENLNAAAAG